MNKFVMMYCNIWTTRLESFAPARGDMHPPRATVKYTPCINNDKAWQSHITLQFLPLMISTMPTTGAYTGFLLDLL